MTSSPSERPDAAFMPRRDTLHWRDLNAREVDLLVAETFDGWHWESGIHRDVSSAPFGQEQLWLLPLDMSISEVPNGEWTTYHDVGRKMQLAPDSGQWRFFYIWLPRYHDDMDYAWLIVRYIHEHLLFSKRQEFYNLIQSLGTVQGTYTERHGLEEERTKHYYASVAWPDMLGYLTPSLICHAGLLIMGVIAPDPERRFHTELPDTDSDSDTDETNHAGAHAEATPPA